ncbi:glycosyltransferase [endosymbiont of Lamellibrachia barhami]|uniref:glycosyltransferase n=1 Tax=endosymbiont of Lamellibrachia barhami TaxID=205975 RepID=UPI0015B2DC7C|nr:glycosyltransferase [endosymbiont of Lamellibrachia barhami]
MNPRIEAMLELNGKTQSEGHGLLAPIAMPFHLPTPIYGAMLAIWHLRPILQRRFPLHEGRPKDFVRFLAWCAIEGRRQYAILRSIPAWDAALVRPLILPSLNNDRWADGFSVAMFFYGVVRYRYFVAPMLRDAKARHRIARAFWRGERHKFMLPKASLWQVEFFRRQFGTPDSLIAMLRLKRKDVGKSTLQLVETFGLADVQQTLEAHAEVKQLPIGDQCTSLTEPDKALLPAGQSRFYLRLPKLVLRKLAWLGVRFKRRPTQFQLASITNRIPISQRPLSRSTDPFGVNLFGYAQGEIGIGEDVRLLALALKSHAIPFCIVNVKPGDNVSQKDKSVDQWIVDEPRYAINIFCTTGIEQVRYACERGLDLFEDRYNIGYWPWELPDWPASCTHAFSMVDELWGISHYTANAYRRAQCPVYAMPLSVTIDSVAPMGRKDFGLPEEDYLFVFSFDFNSTLVRKNPVAVIQAFQCAFPSSDGGRKIGLVVKASHVKAGNKAWKRIKRLIDADPRIHLIDATLRRPEVLALYQCCDCYVSLHRAEGFGRGLAEALMLDLQLIATGFSGNLDFCTEDRVGLVRYRRRDVRRLEYFHADGQSWADPDTDHAAELMRSIRTDPRSVEPKAFDFSPATAGTRYAQRLNEIKHQLNLAGARPC